MKQVLRGLLALGIVAAIAVATGSAVGGRGQESVIHDAAIGKFRAAVVTRHVREGGRAATIRQALPFISGGTLSAASDVGARSDRQIAADFAGGQAVNPADIGINPASNGCSRRGTAGSSASRNQGERAGQANVRVNQDCTYRRQAEEIIKYNPQNPSNLLAGQNDSRAGFNQCGYDFSTDNGQHWGDGIPPFRQRLNDPTTQEPDATDPNRNTIQGGVGTTHTYDAGSDPTVAFDTLGRGFFSCVAFDLNSNASLLYVTQSPRGAQGSFFYNVSAAGRPFIVAEDNSPLVLHDKQFIVADTFARSPHRDNVYVTWTVFKFGCPQTSDNPSGQCSSPIYGSMSTDHAVTWSTPEEISGSAPALCSGGNVFDPRATANDCNMDQGADPVVQPNGNLVVAFNNGNPGSNNPAAAQQLAVRCSPTGSSSAGTAHLNCLAPTQIGNDVVTGEPQCEFGRGPEECVPGPFVRTDDYPRSAVSRDNGQLYVTWQDYRNGEYDIQLARSADGGATWKSAPVAVNPDTGLDHYFPAIDLAKAGAGDQGGTGGQGGNGDQGANGQPAGDRVGVSYYRSDRIANEGATPAGGFTPKADGVQQRNSDYVLSGGTALGTPYPFSVLSPVFPPPDGVQAGFNGDYSGLTINRGEEAHPIWSDTRNADPYTPNNGVVHDEDVFTQALALPTGAARPGPGRLGRR